jgi:3-phenylpropionate/cinnamic acid dioxygenase small subunit
VSLTDDVVRTRLALEDLHGAAADALDDERYEDWADLFVDDCRYEIVPIENHRLGLPLALMRCESKGMLLDRIRAIRETAMYVPRTLRHVVSPPRVVGTGGEGLRVRASYAVFETLPDELTRVFNVGTYHDLVVPGGDDGDGWRFRERLCVYDSVLVPNSLVMPL